MGRQNNMEGYSAWFGTKGINEGSGGPGNYKTFKNDNKITSSGWNINKREEKKRDENNQGRGARYEHDREVVFPAQRVTVSKQRSSLAERKGRGEFTR